MGIKVVLSKKIWCTKIEAPKKSGPKSLIKIKLLRAEILPIWTKVPGRNVAWTNVAVRAEICS